MAVRASSGARGSAMLGFSWSGCLLVGWKGQRGAEGSAAPSLGISSVQGILPNLDGGSAVPQTSLCGIPWDQDRGGQM